MNDAATTSCPAQSPLLAQSCVFCLICQTDRSFGRIFGTVIRSNDDKTFQNSQVCAFRKTCPMNARVCLLVLVTAGFMAIWDADRPVAGRAAVAQSKLQNAVVSFPYAESKPDSLQWVAAKHSHKTLDNAAASESTSSTANREAVIPLPKDLSPEHGRR